MFETTGWIACLITAMVTLYQYLKAEHALLLEHRPITVSGEGLAPHLEEIMFKLFSEIQDRAAKEKQSIFLPGQPDHFQFEVTVGFSDKDNGYIVLSPQIPGCSAWGPTVEYAVLEFGLALHLFAETMLEDGETFK